MRPECNTCVVCSIAARMQYSCNVCILCGHNTIYLYIYIVVFLSCEACHAAIMQYVRCFVQQCFHHVIVDYIFHAKQPDNRTFDVFSCNAPRMQSISVGCQCANLYLIAFLPSGPPAIRNCIQIPPKKQPGYVDSWVLDEKENSVFEDEARFLRYPPKVVLVQYYDWVEHDDSLVQEPCAWHIDGVDEHCVYPMKPWKRAWFLDQRRFKPQLQVAVSGAFGARVFHDCAQRAREDFGVCNYRFADRSRSERNRQLCGHDPDQDSPRLVDLQKLR
jgi:hypothetical protein